jgi:hypothetical protein
MRTFEIIHTHVYIAEKGILKIQRTRTKLY